MNPVFDALVGRLKRVPWLGYRSAERIALHLLTEDRSAALGLCGEIQEALESLRRCPVTGNMTDGDVCAIYANASRNKQVVAVVEHIPDLIAMERSGAFQGTYHVLHGRLSPIHGVGPDALNLENLEARIDRDSGEEVILALASDIESEATCHYIQEEVVGPRVVDVTRIGFGLPSSRGIDGADAATLRNALEGRRRVSDS